MKWNKPNVNIEEGMKRLGKTIPRKALSMNIERAKLTAPNGVFKFNNLAVAKDFADRARKSMVIFLGDDGKYWVVSLGLGEELVKSGYELAG